MIKSLRITLVSLCALFLSTQSATALANVLGTASTATIAYWDCPPVVTGEPYRCQVSNITDSSDTSGQDAILLQSNSYALANTFLDNGFQIAGALIHPDDAAVLTPPPTGIASARAVAAWGDSFTVHGGTGTDTFTITFFLDGEYGATERFNVSYFLDNDYDLSTIYQETTPLHTLFSDNGDCGFGCATGAPPTAVSGSYSIDIDFVYGESFILQSILDVSVSDSTSGDGGFGYVDFLSTAGVSQIELPTGATLSTELGTYNVVNAIVPVPAAAWLFGSGLLGLIGISRRKKMA